MLRIAFSRTAIIVVALLLQLFVFFASFYWLKDYSTVVYAAFVLLGAVTVVHILNEENNASFKIAWIIPVLVIPVFGTVLYIYINLQPGTKRIHKKLTKIEDEIRPYLAQNEETVQELQEQSAGEKGIADYLYHADNYPVYAGCKMKYYPIGEAKFADMIEQLKRAEHFIFMEYFIVAKSYMWNTILEILKEKAAQGVEVRMMYDGMCSLALLPYGYYKDLEKMGIQSIPFSQIRPVLSTYQNNRDHRKILIFLQGLLESPAELLIPVREQNAEAVQRERQERAKVDVNKLQASRMQAAAQAGQGERGPTAPIHVEKKVGRNDPCPCGSGKKFKNCHGKGL